MNKAKTVRLARALANLCGSKDVSRFHVVTAKRLMKVVTKEGK